MADIFREVDEDIRRERYSKLWKRYGKYVIAGAVAIVVLTAGREGWKQYQTAQREVAGERFAQALDLAASGRETDAVTAFSALADDAGAGYATLARLRGAALRAESGDRVGALAVYSGLAEDSSVDPIYRDLAVILLAYHSIDGADPAALSARLAPLTADDNAWRYSARELSALLALRTGEEARARELLESLTDDPGSPPGLRARSAELLAVLGR